MCACSGAETDTFVNGISLIYSRKTLRALHNAACVSRTYRSGIFVYRIFVSAFARGEKIIKINDRKNSDAFGAVRDAVYDTRRAVGVRSIRVHVTLEERKKKKEKLEILYNIYGYVIRVFNDLCRLEITSDALGFIYYYYYYSFLLFFSISRRAHDIGFVRRKRAA